MDRLFSPWRSKYIDTFSKDNQTTDECIFCAAFKSQNDEEKLIVQRGKYSFIIMNLFPYNSGHLMIVPNRHTAELGDLSDAEMLEIMKSIQFVVKCLQSISHPDGFNIGSNLGRSAGAGIDKHLHFHVVPRWSGDTNFMPTLSDTKIISEDMNVTWKKIRDFMSNLP
ncbi:MAG: HIT domain-containing protein [Ignavibacteriales bacterium]|nr:HIT domain-containing protein [Ignavibacteriales bacterium]